MKKSDSVLSFEYNAKGLRTKKTFNNVVHQYYLNASKVLFETITEDGNTSVVEYVYDSLGEVCGMIYDGESYYFGKDLHKNVNCLLDKTGTVVVNYTYDTWGRVESVTDGNGTEITDRKHVGNVNPFRYRSYFYDTETKLYYLLLRYYDPEIGRFINADAVMGLTTDSATYNLFAYCSNDPVNRYDDNGMFWEWLVPAVKKIATVVGDVFRSWTSWAETNNQKINNVAEQIFSNPVVQSVVSVVGTALEIISPIIDFGLHLDDLVASKLGIDTAAVGAAFLDMAADNSADGVYHASANCWQQFFGYNNFYDFAFDIGTSMKRDRCEFSYNGEKYVVWIWKGDYINLGAGAELGIYKGGPKHWAAATEFAMHLELDLELNEKKIIDNYKQHTWWITAFNSSDLNYKNRQAEELTATYRMRFKACLPTDEFGTCNCEDENLDFSSDEYLEKDRIFQEMYEAFKEEAKKKGWEEMGDRFITYTF